jgi:hypothetical protein
MGSAIDQRCAWVDSWLPVAAPGAGVIIDRRTSDSTFDTASHRSDHGAKVPIFKATNSRESNSEEVDEEGYYFKIWHSLTCPLVLIVLEACRIMPQGSFVGLQVSNLLVKFSVGFGTSVIKMDRLRRLLFATWLGANGRRAQNDRAILAESLRSSNHL